ncbi:MAG: hypothetical protein M0P91_01480 [Sulfuricurvum sp.]|jgi:hypothetical protein|uniref:hypothetical protein n=1 Tax=Sulfuricurvum sp. TaxID=2025608 RepID=UPI0025EFE4BE|nr:hypothetical protein [Sulfuricurvum sp.]MCK9371841.1 hypothetical protein [Sulfuricurvum sp.]
MGAEFQGDTVVFEGIVYEEEVGVLRDFLQEIAPSPVLFDFCECADIHLAPLQVVLAYVKQYAGECRYGSEVKMYQKVCEGFERGEEHCA